MGPDQHFVIEGGGERHRARKNKAARRMPVRRQ